MLLLTCSILRSFCQALNSSMSGIPTYGNFVIILLLAIVFTIFFSEPSVIPPVAEKIERITNIHGVELKDDYYWMRERDEEKVRNYLIEENKYTEAKMKHTEEFQKKLYDEFLSRIKQTDNSVPVPHGPYYYYKRTEEGKQYPIFCRKLASNEEELEKATEEIYLDQNVLAEGHSYSGLGVREVSPNHQLLAYSHDVEGDEIYTIYIKDLKTGELLSEAIENTYYGFEWANDGKTFFYTTLDDAHRPFKVMKHVIGSQEPDELIHHETDEKFFVGLAKTRDEKYIFIECGSQVTDEVHYLDANHPEGKFTVFLPREQSVEYKLYHQNDYFLIQTNADKATNFKLMKVGVSEYKPGTKENWKEIIPHRPEIMLSGLTTFKDYLVIWEREDGMTTMKVLNLASGVTTKVSFSESVYTVEESVNCNYNSKKVRITYESLQTPLSVFDYNMEENTRKLLKEEEVLGGYDRTLYYSKREYAVSHHDGTKVPLSMIYKKDLFKGDGSNPSFLYGYGSYGVNIDPYFTSKYLSFLDRGFVFVIAHVRGGGEMGRQWKENGKLLHKKNTFHDFIAAAKFLIENKYTSASKLAISGASAGGLLMGAVVNMAPELFHAVVADVPFVDVINTMLDPTIPLTVGEYEEWGNPEDKTYFDYMLSYSPYNNIEAKNYPNILAIGAINDPRVQYWEPAKWVAKMRTLKTDNNTLLLKMYMEEGHAGASGRYDSLKEYAFSFAFVLDTLGFKE
eukprot:TRINITY_DN5502_c0_g1_i1.p1 TRINITY_DN5502_c0_g1~~TRINITY_DN5502_c0_g1_i1.p1  ORF type:complete len:737 (-),score=170.27 TRINITY_DN5502_c0_g1_i1:82-2292(-)